MKKLALIFSVLFFTIIVNAQPWTKLLPKKPANQITFYDYQKAFNKYWKPYNVDYGKYTDKNGKVHRAAGWKQFKRWEWAMTPQVEAKTGKMPMKNAGEVYKNWKQKNPNKYSKTANWQSLGPNSSEGGYAGVGRINTIAFHPTDNDTYWIAAPAGGLWKTEDDGNSWVCLTDNNPVLGISDIIIPDDYETSGTIYIATGDRDHWDNRSVGVLKSTDFGNSWNTTGLSFSLQEECMTSRLLIDPNNNQTILAATTKGVFKTTDGGTNWDTQLTDNDFIDMEYKSDNFSVLYGATKTGEIYTSNDAGLTWTKTLDTWAERIELAVTPANSEIVYAIAGATDNSLYAIYKSEDGGQTFDMVFDGTQEGNNLLTWDNGYGEKGQAWYDLSITVSPNDENLVLIGGVNTWKSLDGAQSWELVNHWIGEFGVQAVHADKHMLKYRQNGDLFECNDGGVYISSTDGNSDSWIDKSNGIVNSQMYHMDVSMSNPDIYIAGLQDNGTKAHYASSWNDVLGGDGMNCLIDYTNDNIQYGALYYGDIYRTDDQWINYTSISPLNAGDGAWVTPYVLDPNNPEIIYAGYSNLWKSENRGGSWEQISNIGVSSNILSIAVAPSNSQVIYIAGLNSVWKTKNGGVNWENITDGLPSNTKTDITIKNNDPETVWITLGEYDEHAIYKSTDGGVNWTNISEGLPELPVYSVIYNNLEPNEENIYIGTQIGVYLKKGDDPWIAYNNGLPNVRVSDLEIHYNYDNPFQSQLMLSTFGRGLWKTPLELSGEFVPLVKTKAAENISYFSAKLKGRVINNFDENITENGFILSKQHNFTQGDPGVMTVASEDVIQSGYFWANTENLQAGTEYFYKSYAKNNNGTGTGDVKNFITQCIPNIEFPYIQDFERDGKMPICWNEEILSGNESWQFKSGNQASLVAAHSGEYNALLKDEDGDDDETLLKLPVMNFGDNSSAMALTFWYSMKAQWPYIDNLKVVYKSNNDSEWQTLAILSDEVTQWQQCHVDLPNLSDNYQIAFLGNAKYGYGITIDDVFVGEVSSVSENIKSEIKIYPNPTKDFVFVKTEQPGDKIIKIRDITGKLLYENRHNEEIAKINIAGFAQGTYLLTTQISDYVYSQRIIVN